MKINNYKQWKTLESPRKLNIKKKLKIKKLKIKKKIKFIQTLDLNHGLVGLFPSPSFPLLAPFLYKEIQKTGADT